MHSIAFIRTASRADQHHVEQAAALLAQHDITVDPEPIHWHGASVATKMERLLSVLHQPDINVLWGVRGGEGTADLLPLLAKHADQLSQMPPKILIGCSDFTTMLLYGKQHFHWHAVHGPTAAAIGHPDQLDASSIASIIMMVKTGQFPSIPLAPLNSAAETTRIDMVQCIGGNMSLLNISVGDSWQCDPTDKILLIEDWHEKGYVVDRTLKYFERLGWFNQAKAVVFGDMQADTHEPYLDTILHRTAERLTIPEFITRTILAMVRQIYP